MRSRFEYTRIIAFLLACAGILFAEYRLSFPALITSIPAMLCAGIASTIRKIGALSYPGDFIGGDAEQRRFITVSYAIAAVWALCFWPNERPIMLDLTSVAFLAVNATFTALAMSIGKSMVIPMIRNDEGGEDITETVYLSTDDATILILTAIVGCYSTLTPRRSYTTWQQFICFFIAAKCINLRTTLAPRNNWDRQRGVYTAIQSLQLLDRTPTPLENENTMGVSTEDLEAVQTRTKSISARNWNLRAMLCGAALCLLWAAYTSLNFSSRSKSTHLPVLDIDYTPPILGEVVISMYKEPIRDVRNLISNLKKLPETSRASTTIYIKDKDADTEKIRLMTGANKVVKRPNVGREGETYLHHIISNWDSLAGHTIFLQADIHNSREFYTRVENYYDPKRTGYLSLGWSGVCDCESCGDRFFWQDDVGLFPKIHSEVYKSTDCRSVLLSYKGQFIVSAARIRGVNKAIYYDLWHAFVNETSWAHQKEYLQGRPDSMSAPDFGFSVERIWNLLFQCSDMDIAWKCPTLVSEWRFGGDVGDCQCFDTDP